MEEEEFHVRDVTTDQVMFTALVKTIDTPLGNYQELDFSELRTQGTYRIESGEMKTQSFQIAKDIWRETIWKTLNLFYCERCGTEVAGVHGVCHRDWLTEHEGKHIVINGGWHDAGDLSQGLVNTSEAAYAMLSLAETLDKKDAELAARLREEAKWGLEWILKTRFGDGYRTTWATMDIWTDGILGTFDDEVNKACNHPYDNLIAAATEALAARLLRREDAITSARFLQAAMADFQFAYAEIKDWTLALASQAVLAAVELYKAGAGASYASLAVEAAEVIQACQQKAIPNWETPLCGFYYTTPEKKQILHYEHRGHEQAPTVALAALCDLFPEHVQWINWYSAIVWHTEYLRSAAAFTAPYYMISAGIYHIDESEDIVFQEQVRHGIPLGEGYYLRRFPVWFAFRGNSGTVLSQTKALTAAAGLRSNPSLYDLSQLQLEWTVGRNPFVQSLMYGEGYNYAPQYTAASGNMVGSLPVGIETKDNRDEPYWPMQNCYNYKEVWVMPSSRWLWLMEDVYQPLNVQQANILQTEARGNSLKLCIANGALLQGQTARIRTTNLEISETFTEASTYHWNANILDPMEPWVAVLEISSSDGSLLSRSEAFGGFPRISQQEPSRDNLRVFG